MRYLRKFNESFNTTELLYNDTWFRIEDNVKDIFVEYQDSNDLDVVVGKGYLPMTVADLDDDIIEVKLFTQRGIRFNEISGEIGMLIEYMKSLTDKEVKIYYDLDRSGLRNWRPLAGSDNEFDYYLSGTTHLFNTIRLYFVEVAKKLNESSQEDDKIVKEIDDMFIELKDHGFTYLCRIQDVDGKKEFDMISHSVGSTKYFDLNWIEDSVDMLRDYLSGYFGDFTEIYRVGYKIEDSNGQYKVGTIDYDNFIDCISDVDSDIDSLIEPLEKVGWNNCLYHLSGIKIIITQK
jgi:hypothetical protein